MKVSVSEAKGQLTDLVKRAEAGEDVILTRHGRPVIQLTPLRAAMTDFKARMALMDEIQASAASKLLPGPSAARSQDFLYDEDGLPA